MLHDWIAQISFQATVSRSSVDIAGRKPRCVSVSISLKPSSNFQLFLVVLCNTICRAVSCIWSSRWCIRDWTTPTGSKQFYSISFSCKKNNYTPLVSEELKPQEYNCRTNRNICTWIKVSNSVGFRLCVYNLHAKKNVNFHHPYRIFFLM